MNRSTLVWVARALLVALLLLVTARVAAAAAPTDLGIRATAVSFRVGVIGTYTVTVANRGPSTTDAPIHVVDTLPAGLTFAGSISLTLDWSCSAAGPNVDCVRVTPLDPGHSSTFRLRVAICSAAFPVATNTLILQYPADTNGANNSITKTKVVKMGTCATPPTPAPGQSTPTPVPGTPRTPTSTPTLPPTSADLMLTKTTSSTFTVGGLGLYTLSVSNLGPANTNGVITVVDPLPTGLAFVSSSGSGWTCSAAQQTVTCTTPTVLAAGSGTGVTLTVAVGSAAYPTVTNSATLSYAGDPNASNNTAQRPTTIRQ